MGGRVKRFNWQGTLCIILLFLAWEGAVRTGLLTTRLLPMPTAILDRIPDMAGELLRSLGHTLIRMGAGLGLAAFVGVPLGIGAGRSERLWLLLAPTVEACRSLPPALVIIPAMLLLGIDDAMAIFAVGFAAVFPLLISAMDSARSIPVRYMDTARTLGASRMTILRAVILPASAPGLFSGLRIARPIAFIVAILTEMVGGADGIGHFLMRSQRTFDLPAMYAAILASALTGAGLSLALNLIEPACPVWYETGVRATHRRMPQPQPISQKTEE